MACGGISLSEITRLARLLQELPGMSSDGQTFSSKFRTKIPWFCDRMLDGEVGFHGNEKFVLCVVDPANQVNW